MDGKRGLRHGVGKSQKALSNPKNFSRFSPKAIFGLFCEIDKRFSSYLEAKRASRQYNERRDKVKENAFKFLTIVTNELSKKDSRAIASCIRQKMIRS